MRINKLVPKVKKVKVAAGETLDEALATLAGNFSSSNQYFDLLVQVDNPSILCIKCNQTMFTIISGVLWTSGWWETATPGKLLPHPPPTG